MESDADVGKLLKHIFGKNATISDEIVEQSSISSNLLNEDFSKKLALVFVVKKRIVFKRHANFFDQYYREMLSSNSKYLIHIMYVCLYEHESIQNAFDSFISVCALAMHLNEEIFAKTGVYFSDLNSDIMMIFYRNVLKSSFLKLGGISQFVEYIRNHRYLRWNCVKNYLTLSDDPTSVFLKSDLNEHISKEMDRYDVSVPDKKPAFNETLTVLVMQVLSIKSVKFPTLPTESELIMKMVAYRKREKAKNAERKKLVESASTNVISHGDSNTNFDSKANTVSNQRKNITWFENIIQSVTRHNSSRNSGHESANSQTHEEPHEILDQLKTKINSLIEILGKFEN